MKIKVGDYFRFNWSREEYQKRFSPDHCFDGRLVAIELGNGDIVLHDTYWMYDFSKPVQDGRRASYEQWEKWGTLEFVCNINEVDVQPRGTTYEDLSRYYSRDDLIDLSRQHHCYKAVALKPGAERSADVMLKQIEDISDSCDREERHIKHVRETLETMKTKIVSGDLSDYFPVL